MGAGPPEDNVNAEKWTEELGIKLFEDAIKLTEGESKMDFIGEVAKKLGQYRDVFTYLKDKYKPCKILYTRLSQNLEANCFSHGKDGDINPAMAIMNLKANYRWSDRVETTIQGGDKPVTVISLGSGTKPD